MICIKRFLSLITHDYDQYLHHSVHKLCGWRESLLDTYTCTATRYSYFTTMLLLHMCKSDLLPSTYSGPYRYQWPVSSNAVNSFDIKTGNNLLTENDMLLLQILCFKWPAVTCLLGRTLAFVNTRFRCCSTQQGSRLTMSIT